MTATQSIPTAQTVIRFLLPLALATHASAGLLVEDLGKTYTRDPAVTPAFLFASNSNLGGSTSIRREGRADLIWKSDPDDGYFQRNRELGQVFNLPANTSVKIDAIVLRTGNSSSAIKSGTANAGVYLQLFEAVGTPVINNNGTPRGTDATHGFTTNHRADDFIEGITYNSLLVTSGGTFPNIPATTTGGDQAGHLRFLRWNLTEDDELILDGGPNGKRFVFMVGFENDAPNQGFTLGNNNFASDGSNPAFLKDVNGKEWWGVRREGDGTLPPTRIPGANPPADPATRTALENESLFETNHQLTLQPTTDGYPDVDTYRSFEFYIETKELPGPRMEKVPGSILNDQDFSTDPGWGESGNTGGADNFGFSQTANAGGTAGEIGGLFDRGNAYSYYADTASDFQFPAAETVRGSGSFIIRDEPGHNANDDIFFGHLTTTGGVAPDFLLGFRIREPSGGAGFRISFIAGTATADASSGEWNGTVAKNTVHTFSYSWEGNGKLVASLYGTEVLNTVLARGALTFGGFGLASRDRTGEGAETADGYNLFLDGVSYSSHGDGMCISDVKRNLPGGITALRYQSLDGIVFKVERSPDLLDPWTPLPDTVVGNGRMLTYEDTPPAGDRFFYRLKHP